MSSPRPSTPYPSASQRRGARDLQLADDHQLRSLLSKVALENPIAFDELHDRCSGIIYATALKMMRDQPSAEDVFQDSMFKVWRKAKLYDCTRGSAIGWLLTIVTNTATDHLRKTARLSIRRSTLVSHFEMAAERICRNDAAHAAVEKETASTLHHALKQLPESESEAIRLSFFEHLSHREVADTLEAPIGTIKSRIRRGIKKLRRLTPASNHELTA